ncbi:MAG: DUF2283 domain-containing protein [Planctomycetota bacterium]|nr:DUF2283 domain-containing protein [Planctomycetota bacterium]
MRILYDKQTDTAYLQLSDDSEKTRTHACDPMEVNGEINLDFGRDGELIGLEIQQARRLLPADLLAAAERKRISTRIAPPNVPPPRS